MSQIVIAVQGAFDAGVGSALCERLAQMDSSANVVVDFTEACELNLVALTALVNGSGENRARVSLWGLLQHHNRVLQYLGLPARAEPRQYASTHPEAATGQ